MKIFIHKNNSGEFLARDGGWTTREEEAKDFQSSLNAIFYCQSHKMTDVNIVMRFNNRRDDVFLPIQHSPP